MTVIPRPVRNGEHVEYKRADELTDADRGRIVQHPGNRGWLQNTELPPSGLVWVCTTTGVADYPADAMFTVWGYDDPPRCLLHGGALPRNCRACRDKRKAQKAAADTPRTA